jgi:hypothetical protein
MAIDFGMLTDMGSVELDSRGRGSIVKPSEIRPGVRYRKYQAEDGVIVLRPVVEIPANEVWVFQNPERLAAIDRGMAQSQAGRVVRGRSFTEHADEPTPEGRP